MTIQQKYSLLKKYLAIHGLVFSYEIVDDDMFGRIKITKLHPTNSTQPCQMHNSKSTSTYGCPATVYHDFGSTKLDQFYETLEAFKGAKIFDFKTKLTYCKIPELDEELAMLVSIES